MSSKPKTNALGIAWKHEDMAIKVALVLAHNTNPEYPQPPKWRIPGGGGKGSELPYQTALREVEEETGWWYKSKVEPIRILEEEVPSDDGVGMHLKTAFVIPYSLCRGKTRTTPLVERDAVLDPPEWYDLDVAIDTVFSHRGNSFHERSLRVARKYLRQRYPHLTRVSLRRPGPRMI